MKFHKIVMAGEFILQKLNSLVTYNHTNDEGRIIYYSNDCTGYLGTVDGWVPITGVQQVDSLPNWRSCLISRLFFVTSENQLYVGTTDGFSVVGAGSSGGTPVYGEVVCIQCDPPTSPDIGDRYIVCTSAGIDEWAGHETQVATWGGTLWTFADPTDYQREYSSCELSGGYFVWIESVGNWKEESVNSCFSYTDTTIYPKLQDEMPLSGSFFDLDTNLDLMPKEDLEYHISTTWEKVDNNTIMPRPYVST